MIVNNKDNECEKGCMHLPILSQCFSNGDEDVKNSKKVYQNIYIYVLLFK
jgi:hypothetical protein